MKVKELKEYLEPLDNELELTDLYLLNTVKTCKNCGYRVGDQCSAGYSARTPRVGLLTKIKNFLI